MLAARTPANALEPLRMFARRDLREFAGLAHATFLDAATAVFNLDQSWRGEGFLGSERRRISWLRASGAGFARGIRVWANNDEIVLLDAIDAELPGGLAPVLDALGEPDARLDSYLGTLEIERSECVYAQRGLTLYVNSANGVFLRIAAFAPTTLDTYRRTLRLDLKTKRLPESRSGLQEDPP